PWPIGSGAISDAIKESTHATRSATKGPPPSLTAGIRFDPTPNVPPLWPALTPAEQTRLIRIWRRLLQQLLRAPSDREPPRDPRGRPPPPTCPRPPARRRAGDHRPADSPPESACQDPGHPPGSPGRRLRPPVEPRTGGAPQGIGPDPTRSP